MRICGAFLLSVLSVTAAFGQTNGCIRPMAPSLPMFFDSPEEIEATQDLVSSYIAKVQTHLDCLSAEVEASRSEALKVSDELDFLVDDYLENN